MPSGEIYPISIRDYLHRVGVLNNSHVGSRRESLNNLSHLYRIIISVKLYPLLIGISGRDTLYHTINKDESGSLCKGLDKRTHNLFFCKEGSTPTKPLTHKIDRSKK